MIIFINIVGSIPNSFNDLNNALFSKVSYFDNFQTWSRFNFLLFCCWYNYFFQDSL